MERGPIVRRIAVFQYPLEDLAGIEVNVRLIRSYRSKHLDYEASAFARGPGDLHKHPLRFPRPARDERLPNFLRSDPAVKI